jgi:hypothetical protein
MENDFKRMLAALEKTVDTMDETHPNIRVRAMFFEKMVQNLGEKKIPFSPARLAAAVAAMDVQVSSSLSSETLDYAVTVMSKGAIQGVHLYLRSIAHHFQPFDEKLVSVSDSVIESLLRGMNLRFDG